jgi:hypothetical protein
MTTFRLARPLALVAAAAFAVTACGSPSATTTPTGGTPTTGAPTSVPAATGGAVASPPPASGLPGFSFELPNQDKDLEALLPDEIGGVVLTKISMTGDTFLGSPGSEDMEATLRALGKTPADLSVAFGSNQSVVMIAFRVKGVEANRIFDAVVAAAQDVDTANITDVTVNGKTAKKLVDSAQGTSYLYLTGDTLVTITAVGTLADATLNEIFSKLP